MDGFGRVVLSAAGGLLLALAFLAGSASAQQYPVQESALQVGTSQVRPGESVTVSGDGFAANSTVTVTFDATVLGTTQTRQSGAFSMTVTIPITASPGSHTLAATGVAANGATRRLASTVNVLGAGVARQGSLPRTGNGFAAPLAASAALLIGAGSVVVVAARRRRS